MVRSLLQGALNGLQESRGGFDAQSLRRGAARAGISVDIVTEPVGARFAWAIPLN